MTNYGSPGADHRQPWYGRRPGEAYDIPAAPGGWDGRAGPQPPSVSGYGAGQHPDHQHVDEPESLPSQSPEPDATIGRSGRGRTIAVLAILAVLIPAGGAALVYLAGSDDPAPVAALPSVAAVTPGDDATGQPDGSPMTSASALAPESSADPRFVAAGQCVRNDGPVGGRPKLLIAECGADTYEVLRRFDGATSGETDAQTKCGRVEGYTDWYFYNSELDTLDFVLCLRKNTR